MEDKIIIMYLCDRKKCENCREECQHTTDANHAIHKIKFKNYGNVIVEVEEENME